MKIFEFEKARNFWFLQGKSTPPPLLPRSPCQRKILYKPLNVIISFTGFPLIRAAALISTWSTDGAALIMELLLLECACY